MWGPDRVSGAGLEAVAFVLGQFAGEALDDTKLVRARKPVKHRQDFGDLHGGKVSSAPETIKARLIPQIQCLPIKFLDRINRIGMPQASSGILLILLILSKNFVGRH